ncbi:hypothetical protein U6M47_12390, partial [Cutibacterium acnes]
IVIGMYFQPGVDPDDPQYASVMSQLPQPVTEHTPQIHGVHIAGVRATEVRSTAAFIVGLPEAPITDVTIEHFTYSLAADEDLLPTWNSEWTGGLFHDDSRGVKVINAHATFDSPSGPCP